MTPPTADDVKAAGRAVQDAVGGLREAGRRDPAGFNRVLLILGLVLILGGLAYLTWGPPAKIAQVAESAPTRDDLLKMLTSRDHNLNPARDDTLQAIKLAIEAVGREHTSKIDAVKDSLNAVVKAIDEVKATQVKLDDKITATNARVDAAAKEARERMDRLTESAVKK